MPYTGIVLAIVAAHAAAFLILLGHWVASTGMFPQATRSFSEIYETRPLRATLLGIFTYGILVVALLNQKILPGGKGFLLILWLAALLIAMIGSSGLALRVGRNLCSDANPWQQSLRGGVMLALVFITPLIGSLFLLHIGLASGFGAFLLAKPWKAKAPAAPATESPLAVPAPSLP